MKHPRKVRGGIRVSCERSGFPQSWAAQEWLRFFQGRVAREVLEEGLRYATLGQTRRMNREGGKIDAAIQGRATRAYDSKLNVRPFTHEQAERMVEAMTQQGAVAARVLAGELPPAVEELLGTLGLSLFPRLEEDVTAACTCKETVRPLCKHVCCLVYLMADAIATDAFVSMSLRGLPRDELLDRLRQRRSVTGSAFGVAPVLTPVVPGASDAAWRPLEECLGRFWDGAEQAEAIEMAVEPPQVSHPLLRRLGPSPYSETKASATSAEARPALPAGPRFPLVGLLATCYDVISDDAQRQARGEAPAASGEPDKDDGDKN